MQLASFPPSQDGPADPGVLSNVSAAPIHLISRGLIIEGARKEDLKQRMRRLLRRLFSETFVLTPADESSKQWAEAMQAGERRRKRAANVLMLKRELIHRQIHTDIDDECERLLEGYELDLQDARKIVTLAVSKAVSGGHSEESGEEKGQDECRDSSEENGESMNGENETGLRGERLELGCGNPFGIDGAGGEGWLKLPCASLRYALSVNHRIGCLKPKTKAQDVQAANQFEGALLSDCVFTENMHVTFEDIGALESIKSTLKELVMLPLQRPELFTRGSLTQPPKGILLFGPPGTGKTMMAKALAKESGATFLNISNASITSKWFGEGEKYTKAVFTLARKLAPCIVFIDEIDAMLGARQHGEHEPMRKIKNEFMSLWDGLTSKDSDGVIVLGATNRPFDLDEAVLRRMPRRLLVDLPNAEAREAILKTILAKESLNSDFDYARVAAMTERYSGSDLKSLCVAAAYVPIRELLKEEEKNPSALSGKPRALQLSDFLTAQKDISGSVSEQGSAITELRRWNDQYGEGGSRSKEKLSYYS